MIFYIKVNSKFFYFVSKCFIVCGCKVWFLKMFCTMISLSFLYLLYRIPFLFLLSFQNTVFPPGVPFLFLLSFQNTLFHTSANLSLNLTSNLSLDASGLLIFHFFWISKATIVGTTSSRNMHLFTEHILSAWPFLTVF